MLLLPILLAACSSEHPLNQQAREEANEQRSAARDAKAVRAGFAPPAPGPLQVASVDPPTTPAPGALLPPRDRQYRYLGRWAISAEACGDGVWTFLTRSVKTAGKQACDLPDITTVPTGYELQGTCKTERGKVSDTIKLSFDEQRRTMHVDGRTLGPADLLYCGA